MGRHFPPIFQSHPNGSQMMPHHFMYTSGPPERIYSHTSETPSTFVEFLIPLKILQKMSFL
eukprot:UN09750